MLLLLIIVALLAGCTGGRRHAPQLADIEKTLELYQDRDAALDRDTVCQRLGIERHSLNQLLNDHAGGLSLPAYLNSVRLDAAYDLLHSQPDESIADIAAAVGFTPQNLRLQFKKRYGLTPAEYRQSR